MIAETLEFSVTIAGLPKGQPRPKAFVKKGGRASVYDPGTAEGWKSAVTAKCHTLEGRTFTEPLMVSLLFIFPRPMGHFGARGNLKPSKSARLITSKPDVDNAAKAVLDALTAIGAWRDDAQITDLVIRKRYANEGQAPGCKLEIYTLNETRS